MQSSYVVLGLLALVLLISGYKIFKYIKQKDQVNKIKLEFEECTKASIDKFNGWLNEYVIFYKGAIVSEFKFTHQINFKSLLKQTCGTHRVTYDFSKEDGVMLFINVIPDINENRDYIKVKKELYLDYMEKIKDPKTVKAIKWWVQNYKCTAQRLIVETGLIVDYYFVGINASYSHICILFERLGCNVDMVVEEHNNFIESEDRINRLYRAIDSYVKPNKIRNGIKLIHCDQIDIQAIKNRRFKIKDVYLIKLRSIPFTERLKLATTKNEKTPDIIVSDVNKITLRKVHHTEVMLYDDLVNIILDIWPDYTF
jgi:hypothetical protein